MMELDKRDIVAIANNRYYRNKIRFIIMSFVVLGIVLVIGLLADNMVVDILCSILFGGWVAFAIRITWLQNHYVKDFVNEWLQDNNIKSVE